MYCKKFLLLLPILLFLACSSTKLDPRINFKPPKYVQQLPSLEEENTNTNLGAIYNANGFNLLSDKKSKKVNDIINIVISQTASASSTGTKSISSNSNIDFEPANISYKGNSKDLKGFSNELNNLTAFGLKSTTKNTFDGSGANKRTESFSTNISARIVKVLNNGNYFITGRRELLINKEKQIIQISGVINPNDLDLTNTINSNKISDTKILYQTEGDIDNANTQGIGAKFLGMIFPF